MTSGPQRASAPEASSTHPGSEHARGGRTPVDAAALIARLIERGQTVAVAESLTGGLVTAALVDPPGASAAVRGGIVCYATDVKQTLVGVDAGLLAQRGAVDPDVALQLAEGVRTRLDATYGVGVTGVAGPDPQDGVAVGTVYIAVVGPDGPNVALRQLSGDRQAVRRGAVTAALRELAGALTAE